MAAVKKIVKEVKPKKIVKQMKPKVSSEKKKPQAAKPIAAHPTYFEMIKEALLSLKERSGSSPHAIAKFMEEKHKSALPANFRKLLGIQLKNSAAKEKLVKIKASYKLSDSEKKSKPTPVVTKLKLVTAKKEAAPKKSAVVTKKKPVAAVKPDAAKKTVTEKKVVKPAVTPKKMATVTEKKALGVKKATPMKKAASAAKVKKPKSIKTPIVKKAKKSVAV